MTIRRATSVDATLLAEHRAAVWHEVGGWSGDELVAHVPIWTAFLREHLDGSTFVAFLAEEDGRAVASGGMLIGITMPHPHMVSERAGRVQSLYVERAARRRGVARALMAHLIGYAREVMLVSLTLRPSDEARPLYSALGFKAADEMILRFT